MTKNTIYMVMVLTAIWVILSEDLSIPSAAAGLGISASSVIFCYRLLPFPKITNINIFRLAIYMFYLIAQVYLSGFSAIKLILTGANVETVEVKTKITNGFLQTILANSITLTPGSISLELKDNTITVLRLTGKETGSKETGSIEEEDAGELIKGKLERMLLKAER